MKTTRMDVYVKGEVVFSYVRKEGSFSADDVKVVVKSSDKFGSD